jgi:hypothetical protein
MVGLDRGRWSKDGGARGADAGGGGEKGGGRGVGRGGIILLRLFCFRRLRMATLI